MNCTINNINSCSDLSEVYTIVYNIENNNLDKNSALACVNKIKDELFKLLALSYIAKKFKDYEMVEDIKNKLKFSNSSSRPNTYSEILFNLCEAYIGMGMCDEARNIVNMIQIDEFKNKCSDKLNNCTTSPKITKEENNVIPSQQPTTTPKTINTTKDKIKDFCRNLGINCDFVDNLDNDDVNDIYRTIENIILNKSFLEKGVKQEWLCILINKDFYARYFDDYFQNKYRNLLNDVNIATLKGNAMYSYNKVKNAILNKITDENINKRLSDCLDQIHQKIKESVSFPATNTCGNDIDICVCVFLSPHYVAYEPHIQVKKDNNVVKILLVVGNNIEYVIGEISMGGAVGGGHGM